MPELVVEVVVVAASTGRTLDVDETVVVQSSQALPFSEGHDQLYAVEVVLKSLEVVVAAST